MPKLNKSKTLGVTLFFACIFSYTWINSFYIASRNVDYTKYYGYINYFTGIDVDAVKTISSPEQAGFGLTERVTIGMGFTITSAHSETTVLHPKT